ncbi:MAG TPA: hypothetical protein VMY39_03120, partial [Planctomycetota bacterium]|nr:hypothetical protein [Planctomycetota bacterium]
PTPTGTHNLLVINPAAPGPLVESVGGTRPVGRTVADASHPLLADISWRDGLIEAATTCRAAPGTDVVLGDAQGPLILSGTLGERRVVVLAFDPETQPISRTRVFPLLVRNCVAYLASARSNARSRSWRPGQTVRLPVDESTGGAVLLAPDGSERSVPVVDGLVEFTCDRVGVWRLRSGPGETILPVNLADASESDLRAEGTSPGETRTDVLRPALLWNLMIVMAVVLLLIETFLYHRRILE